MIRESGIPLNCILSLIEIDDMKMKQSYLSKLPGK